MTAASTSNSFVANSGSGFRRRGGKRGGTKSGGAGRGACCSACMAVKSICGLTTVQGPCWLARIPNWPALEPSRDIGGGGKYLNLFRAVDPSMREGGGGVKAARRLASAPKTLRWLTGCRLTLNAGVDVFRFRRLDFFVLLAASLAKERTDADARPRGTPSSSRASSSSSSSYWQDEEDDDLRDRVRLLNGLGVSLLALEL